MRNKKDLVLKGWTLPVAMQKYPSLEQKLDKQDF